MLAPLHTLDHPVTAEASDPAHHMDQPRACFQATRVRLASAAELALGLTRDFGCITKEIMGAFPEILPVLRMACTPPMSVAELASHTQLSAQWFSALENDRIPHDDVVANLDGLERAAEALTQAMDQVAFPWLESGRSASSRELLIATFFVADRMCCTQYAENQMDGAHL